MLWYFLYFCGLNRRTHNTQWVFQPVAQRGQGAKKPKLRNEVRAATGNFPGLTVDDSMENESDFLRQHTAQFHCFLAGKFTQQLALP